MGRWYGDKMLKSQKHVFWEALFVTILIFGIGIFLGVVLENWRSEKISEMYLISDLNLLDVKVQTQILDLEDLNCKEAIIKNIEFGDKIYEDARTLSRYEGANRLTNYIIQEHKKYDLLRTLFWINSIKIKEKCGKDFHTIVYLYDYMSEDVGQRNKQNVFSKYLEELKDDYGNKIILIPIARNMDLISVELLTKNYGVKGASVIVDESLIVTELEDLSEIEEYLN
ncbi:MAG: hypothetical protein QF567_02540 [Candidatus Pacearchaeota archaeon]|jgi:hypothetical protein|nr:hypothetical protein [Candidatus Pacearchaeota archaeon]MDP7521085.1 hypothetical protein [Candidatus Pacearchaeota archaeon]|tara:strand:+ start:1257 stop:1934 length:678 start_codon:yes stop_codon:yes gene_type:complete